MIVSTGIRTDIANHYASWMFERFREGYVLSRNPLFPTHIVRYRLTPDLVDAVLFCSKNYAPALSRLFEITERYHTFFHYTITAFGRDLEPNIPDEADRIRTLKELCAQVGRERILWRFTPVFFSEEYPAARLIDDFARLAEKIAPFVSGCVIGFLEPFFSMRTRLPGIVPPENEQKRAFARAIVPIAQKYQLSLQTCKTHATFEDLGIASRGCYTLDAIGSANGCAFLPVRHTGNARGCLCAPARDIGWYDSCPNFCKYCNADRSFEEVQKNMALHDVHSPLLIGSPQAGDEIVDGQQTSYLRDGRQISLFDMFS